MKLVEKLRFTTYPDIFMQPIWQDLAAVDNPELSALAEFLPVVVLRGRAPSTVRKYSGAFLRWKKWAKAKQVGIQILPAKPLHVALYLAFLIQKSSTSAPVEEAINSLSWAHQLACVEDPTKCSLVKQVAAGAKRILAHRTCKKEPITPHILEKLVNAFAGEKASFSDVRIVAICLIGFVGFLRFNEIAHLRESDVHIFHDHAELFIEASKTDQYRDGSWVVIARSDLVTCPVAMLERYMELGKVGSSPELPLFRGIVRTKLGEQLRRKGGISYTRVRELVLQKLAALGLDPKQFGLHSLRSGGASAAANAGVPDRLFKRHGRWRSENAKDGYVKDTMESRLSVSRDIGL